MGDSADKSTVMEGATLHIQISNAERGQPLVKYYFLLFAVAAVSAHSNPTDIVTQKQWIHGSQDCEMNQDPAIDILRVNRDTFVLRQNKCINYEAPFIYLLFGQHTLFVQDTGATRSAEEFPIYLAISKIAEQWKTDNGIEKLHMLVTHSHGHLDHRAGDDQFRNKPEVTLIEADKDAIVSYFGFTQWPRGQVTIDLGKRQLTILPIPGHHEQSLAVYDSQTQWLLTGDTFYPGRLYVMAWDEFKNSIQKLVAFIDGHQVSAILGTHIEMTNKAMLAYPVGTEFQPDETPLPLTTEDLRLLNTILIEMGDEAEERSSVKFIVYPVGIVQQALGKFLGWILGG